MPGRHSPSRTAPTGQGESGTGQENKREEDSTVASPPALGPTLRPCLVHPCGRVAVQFQHGGRDTRAVAPWRRGCSGILYRHPGGRRQPGGSDVARGVKQAESTHQGRTVAPINAVVTGEWSMGVGRTNPPCSRSVCTRSVVHPIVLRTNLCVLNAYFSCRGSTL